MTGRDRAVLVLLAFLALILALSIDWGQGEPTPTVVTTFEDGSYVMSDGTVGCYANATCDMGE